MRAQLEQIKENALKELRDCLEGKGLDALRVKYLGKKGELTAILKQMGKLSAEERPVIGQVANEVREALTQDARITGVRDVTVTQSGKREALVHFTAETVFGDVDAAAPLRLGTV